MTMSRWWSLTRSESYAYDIDASGIKFFCYILQLFSVRAVLVDDRITATCYSSPKTRPSLDYPSSLFILSKLHIDSSFCHHGHQSRLTIILVQVSMFKAYSIRFWRNLNHTSVLHILTRTVGLRVRSQWELHVEC